jgi:hypothetical protein
MKFEALNRDLTITPNGFWSPVTNAIMKKRAIIIIIGNMFLFFIILVASRE